MSKQLLTAFLSGLVFGFGLLISGMSNPSKVISFLDIAGEWDPSLALVMVGAIAVAAIAFAIAGKKQQSLLGEPMRLPTRRDIDRRLVLGGLGFGVGWGLAGFCPGPALVALGAAVPQGIVFVAAMVAGMGIFEMLERSRVKA